MSFLERIQTTASAPANFYGQQAAASPTSVSGVCPNYYDHYRVEIADGYYQVYKPTRDKDQPEIRPFSPQDVFNLKDINGNHITHVFIGLEGMPIGYFIGAKLSNYEQELPNEAKGSHCQTVSADLKLSPEGETISISGRFPLQSSNGVTYNFRRYNADPNAPGVYAGVNCLTYGRATPEYAALKGRAEVISCEECVSKNLDRHGKNSCRVQGEFAIYITKLAYIGPDQNPIWVEVKDLGIEELGHGFVGVLRIGATDLRQPKVNLVAQANKHIPAVATYMHNYVNRIYKQNDPNLMMFLPMFGSHLQTICYPSQMWVAKLESAIGRITHCSLVNQAPASINLDLNQKHELLAEALEAYEADRNHTTNDALSFYEPTPVQETLPPSTVPADLISLGTNASRLFESYNKQTNGN